MKKIILMLFVFSYINVFAQMPDMSAQVKEAMEQVKIMAGKWEGKGWYQKPNGEKSYSNVYENLHWKLDETILILEGVGKNDEGKIVHNAYGVLSYNPFLKKYKMNSHLSNGLSTEASFEVIEPNKSVKWWFEDGRGGTIRYTIYFELNKWKEDGEHSPDGENWNKFFEMNLVKSE